MKLLTVKTRRPEAKKLSIENMPDISEFVSVHRFKKNHIIFYENHMPYGLFILTSGEVEIKYSNRIEKVSAPAFLGISGFKGNRAFSATVKAITDCNINFLSTSSYQKFKQSKHPLYQWLEKYL